MRAWIYYNSTRLVETQFWTFGMAMAFAEEYAQYLKGNPSDSLIGKNLDLDLSGSSPVNVTIRKIENGKVFVEYNNSTPGRIEEFNISEFEYFSGLKINNEK